MIAFCKWGPLRLATGEIDTVPESIVWSVETSKEQAAIGNDWESIPDGAAPRSEQPAPPRAGRLVVRTSLEKVAVLD
jgi:hypothetical protein